MTDEAQYFFSVTRHLSVVLAGHRQRWEPLYPKLLPDYLALEQVIAQAAANASTTAGALHLAQQSVLAAALPVLEGIQAIQVDGHHAHLQYFPPLTREFLEALEALVLLDNLEMLDHWAASLWDELEEELVTPSHRRDFKRALEAFTRLTLAATPGLPVAENAFPVPDQLTSMRAVLVRLDTRIPRLADVLPDLVIDYFRLRKQADDGPPSGPADVRVPPH